MATHAGIQSKFIGLIEETVKAAKPNISNFEILNIYTENINDNEISAHFSYRYSDKLESTEKVEQSLSGDAVLYRGLSENPNENKWIVKSIKAEKSSIEFREGLAVSTENTPSSASTDAPLAAPEEKKTH